MALLKLLIGVLQFWLKGFFVMDFHLCLLFHFKKGGDVVIVQGVPKVRSSNFVHYNF